MSAPESAKAPTSATGPLVASIPASRSAASTVGRSAPTTPSRPTSSCEHEGPRAAPRTSPVAFTSATSVFEPPPSTAITAARLLTLGHLGRAGVAARVEAAGAGQAPRQELGGDDGDGGGEA